MASTLQLATSNPIVFQLALQFYSIKKALTNLGKSPIVKDENGKEKVDGEDTDNAVMALLPFIVYIVAGIALILGGMTMYFYTAYVLDFAAAMLLVIAPLVAYQKIKLQKLGDLRGQHNQLRARENDKLTSTINKMETQIGR